MNAPVIINHEQCNEEATLVKYRSDFLNRMAKFEGALARLMRQNGLPSTKASLGQRIELAKKKTSFHKQDAKQFARCQNILSEAESLLSVRNDIVHSEMVVTGAQSDNPNAVFFLHSDYSAFGQHALIMEKSSFLKLNQKVSQISHQLIQILDAIANEAPAKTPPTPKAKADATAVAPQS